MTARERLSAVRQLDPANSGSILTNKWFVLLGWSVILLLVLLLVAVRQMRIEKEKAFKEKHFDDQADALNLTPEERDVVKTIAELSGIKQRNMIFSVRDAFNSGFTKLKQKTLSQQHDPEAWTQLQTLVISIKEKLGFSENQLQGLNNRSSKEQTSRQIPVGTAVILSMKSDTLQRTFSATITANTQFEMCMESQEPLSCNPGDIWIVQFQNGAITWEFQAITVDYSQMQLKLSHSDYIRFVSRRRFASVTTQKPARIATFPTFQTTDANGENSEITFHSATLIEIGGPCLRFRTPMEVAIRQRVLVILNLKPDVMLQDVGQVRQIQQGDQGQTVLIEVIGLNLKDIDKLTDIARQIALNPSTPESDYVQTEYTVKESQTNG